MSSTFDAQTVLRSLAEPVQPGERVGAQILRACKWAGLTYSRARSIWYGADHVRLRHDEAEKLKRAQEDMLLRLDRLDARARAVAETLRRAREGTS